MGARRQTYKEGRRRNIHMDGEHATHPTRGDKQRYATIHAAHHHDHVLVVCASAVPEECVAPYDDEIAHHQHERCNDEMTSVAEQESIVHHMLRRDAFTKIESTAYDDKREARMRVTVACVALDTFASLCLLHV